MMYCMGCLLTKLQWSDIHDVLYGVSIDQTTVKWYSWCTVWGVHGPNCSEVTFTMYCMGCPWIKLQWSDIHDVLYGVSIDQTSVKWHSWCTVWGVYWPNCSEVVKYLNNLNIVSIIVAEQGYIEVQNIAMGLYEGFGNVFNWFLVDSEQFSLLNLKDRVKGE